MTRLSFGIVAVTLLATTAFANTVSIEPIASKDAPTPVLATDVATYSNLTNGPLGGYGVAPGTLLADDLYMTGGGVLESITFSVYNSANSATTLETADITIYFFDLDTGLFVDSLTATNYSLDLDPGYWTPIAFGGLSSFGINLPQNILAGLIISNNVGGESIGQIVMGAPTVGASSEDAYIDDGASSGWFTFTGADANFLWEITVVPEPASLSLLGLLAAGLIRRR